MLARDVGNDRDDLIWLSLRRDGVDLIAFVRSGDDDAVAGPREAKCHGGPQAAAAAEREQMARVVDNLIEAADDEYGVGLVTMLRGEDFADALVDQAGLPAAIPDLLAGPFAHVVVDEAQELTDAEWQMLAPFEQSTGEGPYSMHEDLETVMQNLVGIFRNEDDLNQASSEIDKLKERASRVRVEGSRLFNPGWHLARDLQCMLTVAEAVTRSALARRESRGAHSRIDYPGLDDGWGKMHNVVGKKAGAMTLFESPVPEMPQDLKELFAEESVTKSGG